MPGHYISAVVWSIVSQHHLQRPTQNKDAVRLELKAGYKEWKVQEHRRLVTR